MLREGSIEFFIRPNSFTPNEFNIRNLYNWWYRLFQESVDYKMS